MTFREALREGSDRLESSASDTPYLDALVILTTAAQITKEQLFARLDDPLDSLIAGSYRELLQRRSDGIPVAYLTHSKEFYGREFYVDERVLIPRADTETLVDAAIRAAKNHSWIRRVHDLGAGSGCIALTLKAERPDLELSASDASPAACEVFRFNAAGLRLYVPLFQTAYFEALSGPFDMIVSNPPYLTDAEVDTMVEHGWPEPQDALRAGTDGLDCIETIVSESVHWLVDRGHLLLEAAPPQMPMIKSMLRKAGFGGIAAVTDLAGRKRVVSGVKNG